jgi:hypothetical protein
MMSESRLRDLMADLVADVESPPMAQRAWRTGRRSRRQRLVAGLAAAAVLVAGAGTVIAGGGLADRQLIGPSTPPAPAAGEPRVRIGPERAAVAGLPSLSSPFAALSGVPASAAALSGSPVARIIAAAQRLDGPVLVLGPGGVWRATDSVAAGEDGSPGLWLISTSISPDSRRLALGHRDGLLLVDATTGKQRPLPVPGAVGRIDHLVWLPGGDRVAVSGDGGAGVVSTTDGAFRSSGERVHERAVSGPGDPVVHLAASELVVENAGTTVRRAYRTGSRIELGQWYGAGWVHGASAAATAFLTGRDHHGEQAVLVIDAGTARVTHLLTLTAGRSPATRGNGCCATIGWLDAQTVLLRDGGQLLAWRFGSGEVFRVAKLPGSTRGADAGYDTAIALAQP